MGIDVTQPALKVAFFTDYGAMLSNIFQVALPLAPEFFVK